MIDDIPISAGGMDLSRYQHLADLTICFPQQSSVDLLIGQDNSDALIPLDVRRGSRGEPFAVRTLFGWSVNGSVSSESAANTYVSHFVSTEMRETIEDSNSSIDEPVVRSTEMEMGGFEASKLKHLPALPRKSVVGVCIMRQANGSKFQVLRASSLYFFILALLSFIFILSSMGVEEWARAPEAEEQTVHVIIRNSYLRVLLHVKCFEREIRHLYVSRPLPISTQHLFACRSLIFAVTFPVLCECMYCACLINIIVLESFVFLDCLMITDSLMSVYSCARWGVLNSCHFMRVISSLVFI